jgi:hypothetical protein
MYARPGTGEPLFTNLQETNSSYLRTVHVVINCEVGKEGDKGHGTQEGCYRLFRNIQFAKPGKAQYFRAVMFVRASLRSRINSLM